MTERRNETVSTGSFNNVNELTALSGGGVVGFTGTTTEEAAVTVGGQAAQTSQVGTRFEQAVTLPSGTNTVTITAADMSGNTNSKNYRVVVSGCAGQSFTYDANGNLATGGGWTYTHNGSSRLVGVSGPGSVAATFGRDGRNRDVKRTINGMTTYLIYDGWNLVAEYDAAGVLTTRYIHGPQVDEILAKVTTTSTTFPLPDALGSTIAVTDASGAVVERVYYSDAFGTPTFKDASGTTLVETSTGTRFLFTGREWLAALGLCDYRNRTYSAELGRFIETDPIRFKAKDVNLYRYVLNAPVNFFDALGLYSVGPARPEANTVICENGKPKIQIGTGNSLEMPDVVKECITAHEQSHLDDVLASNPDICQGATDGQAIYASDDEIKATEQKAAKAGIDCAKKKLECTDAPVERAWLQGFIDQSERLHDSYN